MIEKGWGLQRLVGSVGPRHVRRAVADGVDEVLDGKDHNIQDAVRMVATAYRDTLCLTAGWILMREREREEKEKEKKERDREGGEREAEKGKREREKRRKEYCVGVLLESSLEKSDSCQVSNPREVQFPKTTGSAFFSCSGSHEILRSCLW